MKRTISLLLTLALCIPLVSVPTQAASNVKVGFYSRLADKTITQNVSWDSAYFKEDASTYNHNLAIASLALANAAYDEGEAMDVLMAFGFSDFEGKYDHRWNDWDRVAYTFGYDSKNNVVAVVFRGTPPMATGQLTEWVSNIVSEEAGFARAEGRAMSSEENGITLVKYLQSLRDYGYRTDIAKFWIVGHSRGAAVANIMGKDLVNMGTPKKDVYVYGFATPNYANNNHISDSSYTNIFNICIEEDAVTHNPTGVGKFGTVKKSSVNSSALYSKFKSLTGKDLKPVMSKLGVLSMTGNEAKLYIASEKGKYAHAPETYLALLLLDEPGAEPSGGGSGGGGFRGESEDISITTVNKNMTVDVGAGSTLRFCSTVSTADSARIGAISNGATVYVYGNTKQPYDNRMWAKVRHNNKDGWVNAQYLKSEAAKTTPSLSVKKTVEGSFTVTIPANYRVDCYKTSTATSRYTYVSPKSAPYKITCTKRLDMSDGTTRYFFVSGDKKDCYFVFTSSMSVSEASVTQVPQASASLPKPVVSVNGKDATVTWTKFTNQSQLDTRLCLIDEDTPNGTRIKDESVKNVSSYTFKNLSDGNYSVQLYYPGAYGDNVKFSIKTTPTVSAARTVTIQYNANGGSGAPASQKILKNADGVIQFSHPAAKPTRDGFMFVGWLRDNNSSNFVMVPNERDTVDTGNPNSDSTLTYFAQWQTLPTKGANIIYNANGGTGLNALDRQGRSVSKDNAGTIAFDVTSTVPSREGFTFVGWRFENDASVFYSPGQHFEFNTGDATKNDVYTFYAQWKANSPASNESENVIPPEAPKWLEYNRRANTGVGNVTLSWESVPGATSYEFQLMASQKAWFSPRDYSDKTKTTITMLTVSSAYDTSDGSHSAYPARVRAVNSAGVSEWIETIYYLPNRIGGSEYTETKWYR